MSAGWVISDQVASSSEYVRSTLDIGTMFE